MKTNVFERKGDLEQTVDGRIREFKVLNNELQAKFVELQKTQSALNESEGKLNAMMLSIPDHISIMDKDLNIIWANNIAENSMVGFWQTTLDGHTIYINPRYAPDA